MKLKYLLTVLTIFAIFSCKNDDDVEIIPHDPVAQAVIDDEVLVDFLKSHYLTTEKEIDTIKNGETPLYEQVDTDNITYNDINYKLYYFTDSEGVGINPSSSDSVQVLYKGYNLELKKFDENLSYTTSKSWHPLPLRILGWQYGIPHYKSGKRVIYEDESFGYENTGSGIIFIPSGLAYGERGSAGGITPNECIYFFIELGAVVIADADNDGVVNSDEDINGDGLVFNDDSDEDGIANYLDGDDDGDHVATKHESLDEKGDPKNYDTDNDGIPNYLDPDDDNDGKLTKDEDTNRDGDPRNDDSDGDGTPNYLDSDS